ncbi:INO80 complex subunit B [Lingula anatina]|uniref:INO80 complex subunit B n=1 Tax=Lingula anatina TaxID=7574 RepID=A0A1S3IZI3_LINAN|nr:INO80 complex subunit B [Lingula anatina]|eukprot:XP_013403423.1 INO80 complex subunit B [Lingula anatina]
MGKRRGTSTEDDSSVILESPGSSHKKHKKHKKKHKKEKHHSSEETFSTEYGSPDKPAIKLKIKIGSQTLGTKSVSKTSLITDVASGTSGSKKSRNSTPWEDGKEPVFATKKSDEDTSDEEKQWLDALEKGDLDEYGEVKKNKDPTLMTARQRALREGKHNESLWQPPTEYKTIQLTEEQLQKRQQRAKKRKQQAHEKKEKAKKQTVERLLKKQEIKGKGKTRGSRKSEIPRIRYVNNQQVCTISVPQGFQFPYQTQLQKQPLPPRSSCGVEGCTNAKTYTCSKTGVPLCSLQCYKKNLSSLPETKQVLVT